MLTVPHVLLPWNYSNTRSTFLFMGTNTRRSFSPWKAFKKMRCTTLQELHPPKAGATYRRAVAITGDPELFDLKSEGRNTRNPVVFTNLLSRRDHVCDAWEWDWASLGTPNNRYYHKSGVCRHVENWLDMYRWLIRQPLVTRDAIYPLVHGNESAPANVNHEYFAFSCWRRGRVRMKPIERLRIRPI